MKAEFSKQFYFTRSIDAIDHQARREMVDYRIGDWWIGHGSDVDVYPVVDADGYACGAVLGWLQGKDYGRQGPLKVLPAPDINHNAPLEPELLNWVDQLSGIYVLFLIDPHTKKVRVLNDPSGALGVIFDRDSGATASSPLVFAESLRQQDRALTEAIDNTGSFWFPFGLLPFVNLTRLLPNHILDPTAGKVSRIWPLPEVAAGFGEGSVDEVLPLIHSKTVGEVAHFFETSPAQPVLHLTGGADSRMTLAAALTCGHSFRTMTIDQGNRESGRDVRIAEAVAGICGVKHETRTTRPLKRKDVDTWMKATGRVVSDSVVRLASTQRLWNRGERQLSGVGGEVARAFYWQERDLNAASIDVDELLLRLRQPDHPTVRNAASTWLRNLPRLSVPGILDLAYIELRLGCWAGPCVSGCLLREPVQSPFSRRSVFSLMLQLPERYRLDQSFAREFILALSPDLLEVPFNRLSGLAIFGDPKSLFRTAVPASCERAMKPYLKRIRKAVSANPVIEGV